MKRINMNVFWPAINWNTFTLTKHTPNIRTFIWIWSSLYTLSLVCSTKWCVRLISEQHKQHTALTRSKKSDLHNIYITLLRFDPHLSIFMDIRKRFCLCLSPFTSTVFQYFSNGKNVLAQHFMCHYYPHTQAWIASKAIWIASIERSI